MAPASPLKHSATACASKPTPAMLMNRRPPGDFAGINGARRRLDCVEQGPLRDGGRRRVPRASPLPDHPLGTISPAPPDYGRAPTRLRSPCRHRPHRDDQPCATADRRARQVADVAAPFADEDLAGLAGTGEAPRLRVRRGQAAARSSREARPELGLMMTATDIRRADGPDRATAAPGGAAARPDRRARRHRQKCAGRDSARGARRLP